MKYYIILYYNIKYFYILTHEIGVFAHPCLYNYAAAAFEPINILVLHSLK